METLNKVILEEKFKRVLWVLMDKDPMLVVEKLKVISLIVFWGIQMGYSDDEIIKFCLREVSK